MKGTNQFTILEGASKFHNQIGEIFRTQAPFLHMSCFQEVNVRDLVPEYPYHNHHFDWYVKELNLILELHGAQHYKPVSYGKQSMDLTIHQFRQMQYRDSCKETAALEAGYIFRIIPYTAMKSTGLTAAGILGLLEQS